MAQNKVKDGSTSQKAKALSARLLAVQALYQTGHTSQSIKSVIREYLDHRVGMTDEEGEQIVEPDGALFEKILTTVGDRIVDIEGLINANTRKKPMQPVEAVVVEGEVAPEVPPENREFEPLLRTIMICATAELLAQDIDFPIVINDYLNVTHGFYGQGEVNLVNAVLDSIAAALKSV